MLGEQNTEPFFRFLNKHLPPLKKGESKKRKLTIGLISFKNVEENHCELINPYGIKTKYRILDEFRHLYELSESVLQENGNYLRTYLKK